MIAVGAALLIVLAGVLCRTDVYGAFLRGAQQGMETAKSILPALCAALWMTACLRGTGSALTRAQGVSVIFQHRQDSFSKTSSNHFF